jgi:thioredoxin-related protein
MRIILFLVVLIPCLIFGQGEEGGAEKGVHFQGYQSWEGLVAQAKAQNKYIFVDCFATWCGPCKLMDKNIYPLDSIGEFINQRFISIRVQCDINPKDGEETRAKYGDAKRIVNEYKVKEYPTMLFFSPDGQIVHKDIGYQNPRSFTALLKSALDKDKQYFTLVREYEEGRPIQGKMGYLAECARHMGDTVLFTKLSRSYIEHLSSLTASALCKETELKFLLRLANVLSSKDNIFTWLLHNPRTADSVVHENGFSSSIVNAVIYNEEISPAIKAAMVNERTPDWNRLSQRITGQYGNEHSEVLYKGEMHWYESKKDSENLCTAAILRLESGGYLRDLQDRDNQEIVNEFSWQIFLHSHDPAKLEKALSLIDLMIDKMTDKGSLAGRVLDTKANLLYKLGRRDDAILLESRAVALAPQEKAVANSFEKMKEGKPTW